MAASDRRAHALERESVSLMEATVPARLARNSTRWLWTSTGRGHSTVVLLAPAVRARCDGELPLGTSVRVRLAEADPDRRLVRFVAA